MDGRDNLVYQTFLQNFGLKILQYMFAALCLVDDLILIVCRNKREIQLFILYTKWQALLK